MTVPATNLEELVLEHFADKVGEVFALTEPGLEPIPLSLMEAETVAARHWPAGMRKPFSLVFLAREQRVLPQRLYRLEHPAFGALEIFLVPIGRDADGVSYQATFN